MSREKMEGPLAQRDAILDDLAVYLDVDHFPDYGPQGLQVEGRSEVRHVVTGVSACVALFEKAAELQAEMVLVHHGLFWDRDPRILVGGGKRRVKLLLKHDITLAGYHLCLDAHLEVGNNALAARRLGLSDIEPWAEHDGRAIGVRGRWPRGVEAAAAIDQVNTLYETEALVFPYGPDVVRTVGVVSGGAQRDVRQAIADGLDLFVTGEVSEFVMHEAREAGIHFVAAGHYNTERLGIRAVGDRVADLFDVRHTFVDLPNPV
jgi:dinuclear metal center YbgI/SA1388 family protein